MSEPLTVRSNLCIGRTKDTRSQESDRYDADAQLSDDEAGERGVFLSLR